MEILITILVLAVFYIGYKVFVKTAKAITGSEFQQEVFSGEMKKDGTKFSVKIREWFAWNVTVNNEKGTAGGNVKINFPLQYAALLCLAIAVAFYFIPFTAALMPFIFTSFAIFYFRKWYLSLNTISAVAKDAASDTPAEKNSYLFRSSQNKVIAGVCRGLSIYYGVSIALVRLLFIAAGFFMFLGIAVYILLWIFLPVD